MSTSSQVTADRKPATWLEPQDFERVVRFTPLVSIDIVVRSKDRRVLLGRRKNEPARNSFFVPGGRITKNETLEAAFKRITAAELGVQMELNQARFIGVYEHIYKENFFEKEGFGTHYVVLAYELILSETPASLPTQQHDDYVWKMAWEVLDWPAAHENTKAYFRGGPR
jgi:colanic acid biosynthesis protein WcaH